MKRILTSIVLFATILTNSISFAQTTHPVELGFNLGASWLQSDVKMKKLGGAGGFTLGQMYLQNDKSGLDWGWRFRYLNALAYGQDNKKSMGIAYNPVLNGEYNNNLNYNDSIGFVYQNYKTTINELSLELVLGANRMRNNTKVYPYIFGGLGITQAVTKTNQLDGANVRYDYMSIDSNGTANGSQITSSLNTMYDGSYETTAEGSELARWKFMPSLGVGLGYQFTPGFSMGLEHKMTWALHDGLDGQQWNDNNSVSASKDKYHYSSVWLKFSFGRKARPVTTTNTNTNTNTTNIVTTTADKPTVVITNPSVNSYTSTSQNFTVKATIKNVNSKSDINLKYNGVNNSNFTYDVNTKQFEFPLMLLSGSNTFEITATNASGNTTDNATVLYQTQVVVPPSPGPIVTINSPTANPFSTTMNNAMVVASVFNVTSQSQIGVTINGIATGSFTFNPTTHAMTVSSNLNPGANTFVISATNAVGSDSKSVTIIYSIANVTPPPFITIVNPAVNPFTSSVASLPINAIVQNVTSVGQISVTTSTGVVPTSMLSFNPSTGQLNFNANLMNGANAVTISATNVAGADSKSISIIYNQPVAVNPPPVVTILNPSVNPFTSGVASLPINALVQNVTSVGQISVTTSTGIIPTSMLSFNPSTGQLNFNANLINGANAVTISATNVAGADSKSITIIYNQPVAVNPPPVVTILNPSVNPFTSSVASLPINALVQNVTAIGQISVTTSSGIIPTSMLSFNPSTGQLNFNANLVSGSNSVTISATNVAGADSKSTTIIYNQPVATNPAPVVTITSPTVNPFNTSTNVATINAIVLNVTAPSQISVLVNGISTSAFSYNVTTKQFTLTANLIAGANMVSITASNSAGSDSKSQTIIYTQPVAVQKPVVTITVPNTNPFNTSTAVNPINATVLNVIAASQIAVTINGVSTSAFTYSTTTKQLTMSPTLIVGANVVSITATTAAGSDSKSTTIIYNAPIVVTTPAPIVTITTPNVNPFNTSTATTTVNATVLNVTASSQIIATLNGATVPFTYNVITKQLTMPITLISGANVVSITATTSSGSDSKSTTIIYTAPVVTTPAPVVSITYPTVNPLNITIATSTVYATVLNVTSSSQIAVTKNGVTVPFTYNATTKQLTLTASLVSGTNVITIVATTPSGSDTKSTTIVYTAPVVVPAPVVTFTRPIPPSGISTTPVYNVEATVTNISSSSGITVKVNGVAITTFTYTAGTNQLKFNANVVAGTNTVTVTATNATGTDTKSVLIIYKKNIDPLSPDSTNTPGTVRPKGTPVSVGSGTPAAGSPTITFGLPNPYSASTPVVEVTAVVNGIAIQTDAVVKVNGVAIPFVYTVKTKTISFTANLNVGANTITITATNPSGSRTETLTINR